MTMRKSFSALVAVLLLGTAPAFAQMTDAAVVDYVKSGLATGKGEKEIGKELLAKGVTMEQMQRLKDQYEQANDKEGTIANQSTLGQAVERNSNAVAAAENAGKLDGVAATVANNGSADIFGHNIFNSRTLSFEPNENTATPENYVLGPGDEIIIDIWGYNEASIRQTISPEGRIIVSQIGPIYLNGMTIKDASKKIRKALSQKYAGVEGTNSDISVTLGQIRTIQINVMGEVGTPGTYRLSSFATVFNALYRAGGVTQIGTLREVQVIRGGKPFKTVDIYGYIFDGKSDSDIRLQEGDVIIVPPYKTLAHIGGNVKRPMAYELAPGEDLAKLIEYAGGFTGDAYEAEVRVVRSTGKEMELKQVKDSQYAGFQLEDGDVVTVGGNLDRFANRVEIRGSVFRPGMYQLGGDIATAKQLIARADGLKEDAFLARAMILREKEDLSLEMIALDLTKDDAILKKNDVLVISSKHELEDRGTMTINGAVLNPGTFPFAENTTIEDLIMRAGGLLEGASLARVDVARILKDPHATEATDTLGVMYSLSIKDGLVVDGEGFTIQPYDVVSVRFSPGFKPQRFVRVDGEVAFPGQYVMLNNGERISDLVRKAGGITPHAYLKGGILSRNVMDEEKTLFSAARRMITQGGGRDSVDVSKLNFSENYTVALELDKALENPGSDYDLILMEGDRLIVPEYVSTVKIQGDVMYPNTVLYSPGKNIRYYVNKAGGYGSTAKRSKVYIVYMNGNVAKGKSMAKIEPGCEIIIPSRRQNRNKLSAGEYISMGTASASMATMIATLANILTK